MPIYYHAALMVGAAVTRKGHTMKNAWVDVTVQEQLRPEPVETVPHAAEIPVVKYMRNNGWKAGVIDCESGDAPDYRSVSLWNAELLLWAEVYFDKPAEVVFYPIDPAFTMPGTKGHEIGVMADMQPLEYWMLNASNGQIIKTLEVFTE